MSCSWVQSQHSGSPLPVSTASPSPPTHTHIKRMRSEHTHMKPKTWQWHQHEIRGQKWGNNVSRSPLIVVKSSWGVTGRTNRLSETIKNQGVHSTALRSGRCWAGSERDSRWWSRDVCEHDDRETSRHGNIWTPGDRKWNKVLTVDTATSIYILCIYTHIYIHIYYIHACCIYVHIYVNMFACAHILTGGAACWQTRPHGSSAGPAGFSSSEEHSKPERCPVSLLCWCHTPDMKGKKAV